MSRDRPPLPDEPQVVRQGYLRRLKTMKRKYFVLKSESKQSSARLEYYDSEKKFRAKAPPKRAIPLKSCFNINRRLDTKYKHVIALYTKEEGFCVVLDNEDDLRSWLNALITLHHGDEDSDDHQYPKQHVWTVNVQKKGLGASKSILGQYNLCLTDKTVSLTKIKTNNNIAIDSCVPDHLEFSLRNIRRCGNSECFFYMEVGRQTVTGAGELWMHTDDNNIASSMHTTILRAMSNSAKECGQLTLQPMSRDRSMSVNDATKPLAPYNRRLPDSRATLHHHDGTGVCGVRNRCDSMPSRVCPRDDTERAPSRVPSQHLDESAGSGCDTVDGPEWTPATHHTPRIPEEPDQPYCEMNPPHPRRLPIKINNSTHHSRNSSLAEDASPTEGYLSMSAGCAAGAGDAGYVDMQAGRASPAASAGSVASGTPSTDLRFSEYHLDPVSANIPADDSHGVIPRAHSVGSRPGPAAARHPSHDARTRAFSVGSKSRASAAPAPSYALKTPHAHGANASSAPLLAARYSVDTLSDDLMELDFSNNQSSPRARPVLHAARTPPAAPGFYASTPRPAPPRLDEYVDMSPSTARPPASGYVEMRPSDGGLTPTSDASLARSPPARSAPLAVPAAPVADGYVVMNYGRRPENGRTPSRPIQISSDPSRTRGQSRLASDAPRVPPTPSPQRPPDDGPAGARNARKPAERQRRDSKEHTIFSLSLDSPASPPPRADPDGELHAEDVFEEGAQFGPLSTVREEPPRRADSPSDYVVLKPSSETARSASRPIATRAKLESEADESEALLSCNPTATKTLARGAGEGETARKSSSPRLNSPQLIYASLDLEPASGAPPSPAQPNRTYTEIDFARSEKHNALDTNSN